jgi:hypothetical protein
MSSAPHALYVENRVWMIGSRFAARPAVIPDNPRSTRDIETLESINPAVFSPDQSVSIYFDCEPNRPRSEPAWKLRLAIDFDAAALDHLSKHLSARSDTPSWELKQLQLLLYDAGQLNLRAMWAVPVVQLEALGKKIDDEWDNLSNAVTSLHKPLLAPLLDFLVVKGHLKRIGIGEWGVPGFLANSHSVDGDHTPYCHTFEDAFTLTSNLFVQGEGPRLRRSCCQSNFSAMKCLRISVASTAESAGPHAYGRAQNRFFSTNSTISRLSTKS